ncbi:membrane protein of unknown function [Cardinium endosymbiont cEper1 of Encarsia pergandiella]|uniref:RDD family protein n=1 Tax=Cardinium endosymbiont of Encarsia pergandiella TaxID=249402 RepID=UPI00027EA49E|nr:RDD family protein [Cardinium endosymbiont of Encarsia pergandiella]CCM10267.1 membrane protein of unknown function [Cardinium endosymbiont cEper1 of Encarsia pergandiella]
MKDSNWIEPEKITAGHAWRRWAARGVDQNVLNFLYCIILVLVPVGPNILWMKNLSHDFLSLVFQSSVARGILYVGLMVLLILLCFRYFLILLDSLVVAASMTCFGNTPGKQLFGIKILHETGRSITFKEAFKCEMIIRRKSLYILIPIIGIIMCLIYTYRA